MTDTGNNYFALRHTGEDGITRLFTAQSVGIFPTTGNLPSNATPETRATVAALEALLGDAYVVPISSDQLGNEGQMIEATG